MFIYVMKFLQELLKHSQWNQLDREFLTIVFSRVFIEDYLKEEAEEKQEQIVAQKVIVNMIRFLLSPADQGEEHIDNNEGESDSE